jgi:hypothetical protein
VTSPPMVVAPTAAKVEAAGEISVRSRCGSLTHTPYAVSWAKWPLHAAGGQLQKLVIPASGHALEWARLFSDRVSEVGLEPLGHCA